MPIKPNGGEGKCRGAVMNAIQESQGIGLSAQRLITANGYGRSFSIWNRSVLEFAG